MNKHILAFVSIFALGVILTTYYVLIPMGGSQPVTASPSIVATYSPELYFETLINERKEEHNEVIVSCQEVIVSEETSGEEKEVALNRITNENNIIAMELTIDRNLATLGYLLTCTKITVGEDTKRIDIVIYQDPNGQIVDKLEIFYMVLKTVDDNSYDVSLDIHN